MLVPGPPTEVVVVPLHPVMNTSRETESKHVNRRYGP
jgi:hypothetical protein